MQACSYTIDAGVRSGDLPYVGDAVAPQMRQICSTGTCKQLEQMRCADVQQSWQRGDLQRSSNEDPNTPCFMRAASCFSAWLLPASCVA